MAMSLIQQVFGSSPFQPLVEHAKKIIRAFEVADTGLVVLDGKLIEKPVLREMKRILSIAERVSS